MSCESLKRKALAFEDLEPALWGTLAPCLLDLVFLCLSIAQISQLRLLSKLWKAAIDSVESEFNLLLEDKVYPNLFGLIGPSRMLSCKSCVWMLDANQDRWCVRGIDRSVTDKFTVGAADGGLVCFVSVTTKDPLTIVVMNPLTGKKVELPRLLCISELVPTIQPTMLQLKMNRKNNHYKVFFMGFIQSGYRGLTAQVYDSWTKEWSVVGSREKSWGRISGFWYDYGGNGDRYIGKRLGPCVYDFAQGQLRQYHVKSEQESLTKCYAMLLDRFFFLSTEERGDPSNLIQNGSKSKYMIYEYQLQENAAASVNVWVSKGTHGCQPFDDYSEDDYLCVLHACNGYLMVMARYTDPHETLHMTWLYNLSTFKWRVLPDVPGFNRLSRNEDVLVCELRWSATP